tara:strand:+ start:1427 stop:1627 length:201 start_codon:yes stop_codon:yes gene_type:complete
MRYARDAPAPRQRTEFNFKRTSSVAMRVFGVDVAALDDITTRLQSLVDVLESADGSLTEVPEPVQT